MQLNFFPCTEFSHYPRKTYKRVTNFKITLTVGKSIDCKKKLISGNSN